MNNTVLICTNNSNRKVLRNEALSSVPFSNTDRGDKLLSWFVCVVIASLFLVNCASVLEFLTHISSNLLSNVSKIVIGGYFLFALPSILKRINLKFILFTILFLLLFATNYFFFPNTRHLLFETAITFWTTCYMLVAAVSCVNDFSYFEKSLRKVSVAIAWSSIVFTVIQVFNYSSKKTTYSMGFGYSCLLPALMMAKLMFDRPSLLSIIRFTVIFVSILLVGSRGPLVCIFVFIVCYLLLARKKQKIDFKAKAFSIVFAVCLLLTALFYKRIVDFLIDVLSSLGIGNYRTLSLISENILYNSHRDSLYEPILKSILSSPLQIRGINSDYLLVGVYSHNLFLELFYEFGAFFGALFSFFLIVLIVKTLFFYNGFTSRKNIMLLLACTSIPSLMFSGSLWTNHYFWMWIALLVIKRNSKSSNTYL